MSKIPTEHVEWIRPVPSPKRFRAVLFDFDGTLSLIRECWPRVMVNMMVELLQETNPPESPTELASLIEEMMMRLNGRPAHFQMSRFAEEVQSRGGVPLDPEAYHTEYQTRLLNEIETIYEDLRHQRAQSEDWAVPGVHSILQGLHQRGIPLYLASGTEITFVRREADLLDVGRFFGEHLYAPLHRTANFSKRDVIEKILRDQNISGDKLLSFGDGVVETQEVKRVGGFAVAVASSERGILQVQPGKRERLIQAGADAVIPHYQDAANLLNYFFGD